ncbi:fibronectin type III domain-containing protein [Dactylosporangium sp. AC04546]|uniref:fibronectin type III domain-containing protein n=1 Tax=Dactylosporangium sp. AC04546 TaxID=2862460 RepID=UPI001EDE1FF6|nr:fibronectin type III domain-containing protein [Dactylosporangium sp. AC04546]WVK89079.1 fibronectin type III domain-containing protein [Dactylosporangium sp. AC04546]
MSFGGLSSAFRVRLVILAMALVGTVAAGVVAAVAQPGPTGDFLGRRGTTLLWGGRPYRFVGQSVSGLIPCAAATPSATGSQASSSPPASQSPSPESAPPRSPAGPVPDADLEDLFGKLRTSGIVRTWAPPGASVAEIKRVVATAKRFGQRVTLVLGPGGDGCSPAAGPEWYRTGYEATLLPWIGELVPLLRDEPALAMWELAAPPPAGLTVAELRRFYDAAGAEVHRQDPNHLVASGSGGPPAGGGGDWQAVHESGQIDVVTMVDLDMNAGPAAQLDTAKAAAAALDKPLVVTEIGVYASRDGDPGASFDPSRAGETACVDWRTRAARVRAKLDATLTGPVAGAGIVRTARGGTGTACTVAVASGDDPLLATVHDYTERTPETTPAGSPAASPSLSSSASPSVSPSVSPSPVQPRPAVPGGLTGKPGNGQVTLCWQPAEHAAWYSVFYRDTTTGQDWQRMGFPVSGTCWTGNLYTNGHRYEFKVRGAGPNGESADSKVVTVTPAAPRPGAVTLTGEPGNGVIKLCWTKAANATGYNVYYHDVTAGQAWTLMPYPVAELCWTGNLFTNGHTYELKVRGANGDGEGPDSNVVAVVPHA